MHAYSQDLRDRVLRALERGESPSEIARRFEVSRVWVYDVRNRFRDRGERCSHPIGGQRRSRIAHLEAGIRAWIQAEPDLSLAQLCQRVAQQGIQIKVAALWHQLDKWKLSFKKNAARQRARASRRATGTP
ncbi:MAG: helix-turn-helix domain-containing protein [Betaproteobacteria bacterium]|nr:helix-turn-helix domain-containing protein [Betaproteobacteria bacterium]